MNDGNTSSPSNQQYRGSVHNADSQTTGGMRNVPIGSVNPPNQVRHGSPIFYALLEKMAEVHNKKSHDYASDDNPFGNYHFAGQLSLLFASSPEDAGFVGRIGEKLYRLANLERSGKTPRNESIEDTEDDLCVIMVLWMADRRNRRMRNSAKSAIPLSEQLKYMAPGTGPMADPY